MMTKLKYLSPLILLIIVLVVLTSCSKKSGNETASNKDKSNTVSVKTLKLKATEYTDFISVVGTVKPYQKALISTTEGGKIIKFSKEKGDYVVKGDTIVIIDHEALEANLQATKAQYELAKITYEKQEIVYKENVNSEIQYLQAKYNLQQMEAKYKLIKDRFNNTFINAPFSGYIDRKYYDVGELAPVGQPIVLLIDIAKVKVEAGVPSKYVETVKKGDGASVYIKAIDKEFKGRITFVGISVNAVNRTFPIEITLSNKGRILKPELMANVKIQQTTYDNMILVPTEVISRVDEGYIVYILEDGKARSRKITILKRTANEVAVSKGLKAGDELIVIGYQNLIDGQKVNVVE